ncbi:hypothetical protein C8Q74DRAFT_1216044 [Fomes fomentarius]|nr:hypothetical protein C8Q74DRAFT_1216044 [Fomes fomentarius]
MPKEGWSDLSLGRAQTDAVLAAIINRDKRANATGALGVQAESTFMLTEPTRDCDSQVISNGLGLERSASRPPPTSYSVPAWILGPITNSTIGGTPPRSEIPPKRATRDDGVPLGYQSSPSTHIFNNNYRTMVRLDLDAGLNTTPMRAWVVGMDLHDLDHPSMTLITPQQTGNDERKPRSRPRIPVWAWVIDMDLCSMSSRQQHLDHPSMSLTNGQRTGNNDRNTAYKVTDTHAGMGYRDGLGASHAAGPWC